MKLRSSRAHALIATEVLHSATATAVISDHPIKTVTAPSDASDYADDEAASATQVVSPRYVPNPLLWKFAVGTCAWLLLCTTSTWAATFRVGIGDDCDVGVPTCFNPSQLIIDVGDSVEFYNYADTLFTGPHNVVADDGSFRCARGCDGEGGDGTPASDSVCNGTGFCVAAQDWSFTRTFNAPGVVSYHDEISLTKGVIVVRDKATFAIGPGITGSWYDPAQSGHGLFVEVLPGNRFYVAWFTFNPAGTSQAWFTGVGTYSGNTATINAVEQPTGGRWIPNFDPRQVVRNPWGTLRFTFFDCTSGKVDFDSVAGYGTGSMNLTRLTLPAGLTCDSQMP